MSVDPVFDPVLAGVLHRQYQALRDRLLLSFPAARFAHDAVPARLTPNIWAELVRRTPFVGLGWTGITPQTSPGRVLQADVDWAVFLVAANLRPEPRFLGDAQGPGLFGMTQVAVMSLHGFTIGGPEPYAASGTCQVSAVANASFDGQANDSQGIATITLKVPAAFTAPLDIAEFLSVGVTWEFPVTDAAQDDFPVRAP